MSVSTMEWVNADVIWVVCNTSLLHALSSYSALRKHLLAVASAVQGHKEL